MSRILFTDVRIFDGSGQAPFNGEVLVDGDRIVEVAKAGRVKGSTEDAQIVTGHGATLMPGMIEAHAHLSWPSSIEKFIPQFILPPEDQLMATVRNARILLESGFTSAYSAGALGERIEIVVRDEIESGGIPGPRLRASTIERSPEDDHAAPGSTVSHGRGPEAIRAFVKHCKEMGVDQVKLVLSGEDALKPGSSQDLLYTEEEAQAAGAQARESDIWLSAHTQASEAIKMGIRAGVRVFYHCTYADEEAFSMLVANKDKIFVAPAIGIIVATIEAKPPPHFDMSMMKKMAEPVIEKSKVLIPRLKAAGVRILPGGDYGFPHNPNGANARDLMHFVNLFGFTPTEALVAATKLGGELMGRPNDLGLVKDGYLADLLLIDGDPTKDISLMTQRDKLLMIMKGGHMHKAPKPARAPAYA